MALVSRRHAILFDYGRLQHTRGFGPNPEYVVIVAKSLFRPSEHTPGFRGKPRVYSESISVVLQSGCKFTRGFGPNPEYAENLVLVDFPFILNILEVSG